MKILLTMNLPITREYGGANKSNRVLAEEFVKKGHNVIAVTPALAIPNDCTHEELLESLYSENLMVSISKEKYQFTLSGVEVHAAREAEHLYDLLKSEIKHQKPDWIFVSTEDPSQRLLKAALEESPHNIIFLCHTQYMLPFGRLSFFPGETRTRLISKVKLTVCISRYMADYIKESSDIQVFVNHPPHFELQNKPYRSSFDKQFVLMNNPCAVKGINILLGLATALPNIEFAVVPGWGTTPSNIAQIKNIPNITFLKSTSNLDKLFSNVSILLMPSLWEEAFGMIVVDALARGIPVISSKLGGLIEAKLGTNYQIQVNPITYFSDELDYNKFPNPIIPEQDISRWKEALETLLSDRTLYEKESKFSRKNALDFVKSLSIDPLIIQLDKLKAKGGEKDGDVRKLISNLSPQEKLDLLKKFRNSNVEKIRTLNIIEPVPSGDSYPVSYSQKQILFVDEITTDFYGAILGQAIQCKGKLNINALNLAVNALIERHESLRTKFVKIHGEHRQVITESFHMDIEEIDLAGSIDIKESRDKAIRQIFNQRFDLRKNSLLRIKLLNMGNDYYVIVIAMHHVISDGLSIQVFIHDLLQLYQAFCIGKKNPLQPLKIQFKDFVSWYAELLKGKSIEPIKKYWMDKLSGTLPLIELPYDFQRPKRKTFVGQKVSCVLTRHQTANLIIMNQKFQTSIFISLLSIIKVLLYRYSNQNDIIIGTPVSGRKLDILKDQIGYFVNMISIRNEVSGRQPFSEFIRKVKDTCLDAYDHQDYPFDLLIEDLNIIGDISRSPVFDIMISMSEAESLKKNQSEFHENIEFEKVVTEDIHFGSSHDLAFIIHQSETNISISIVYNIDLFKNKTIHRMSDHLKGLISGILIDNNAILDDIDFISNKEKKMLLNNFSVPQKSPLKTQIIHQQFENIVKKFPDHVACRFNDEVLSYEELNKKSNQFAHALRLNGVVNNSIVGILVDRSTEMIIIIIGILKAGGSYMALDSANPVSRIESILVSSACKFLVCPDKILCNLSLPSFTKTIWIDNPEIKIGSVLNPKCINEPDDVAYIIHTSGSTGNPKGVMIKHENLISLLFNKNKNFDFSENDKWTLFHSINFDFSVWEIFGALLYGGQLIIVPKEVSQNTEEFLQLLEVNSVTILNQVPGAFYNLSEVNEVVNKKLSLRYIIFGGDVLHPSKLKSWRKKYPFTKMINMYGITETTIHVTFKELSIKDLNSGISNIGKPLPSLKMYILNRSNRIQPIGICGEIYVSGSGLAKGYLNDRELTCQKFLNHPYDATEKIYKTGDLGKTLPNGDVEYLGRIDNQLKIRGYRIELAEIEYHIRKFKKVKECVVLAHKIFDDDILIHAFIVGTSPNDKVFDELLSYLKMYLPSYMLPSEVTVIDQIPLTINGKIDREKLLIDHPMSFNKKQIIPVSNSIEKKLKDIWEEVLGHNDFGIRDDFFQVGGHSLKAAKVTALIHKNFDVEIKLGHFFDGPTIFDLANNITFIKWNTLDGHINKDEIEITL